MKTIWKYPVPAEDEFTLDMPQGSVSLSVRNQGNYPCLWALVDPDAPKKPHRFRVFGTGQSISDAEIAAMSYVGTFQIMDGVLIFHLFDKGEEQVR